MTVIKNSIALLFLFYSCNSYSMRFRKPAPQAPPRITVTRNSTPHNSYSKPQRSYSNAKQLQNLGKKIKECCITEDEYLDEYNIWDVIVTECAWKGECLSKKCTKESNCLLSAQFANLAWKKQQKKTDAHEIARNILEYRKNCSKK
ncbi:hypothetical protein BH09DEP1_BH09DEP1_6480 [soil metagenome]